jgi:hypothetical protein
MLEIPGTLTTIQYQYADSAVLKRLLIILSACLFQFGCTTLGPDFIKPESPIEAADASLNVTLADYDDVLVSLAGELDLFSDDEIETGTLDKQQERWTSARGDIALNLIAVYKALGGGWSLH